MILSCTIQKILIAIHIFCRLGYTNKTFFWFDHSKYTRYNNKSKYHKPKFRFGGFDDT